MPVRGLVSASVLLLCAMLGGCATVTPMAYSEHARPVAPGDAVLLMTATIGNSYHHSFHPKVIVVNVERGAAEVKADRINFRPDDKGELPVDDAGAHTYLLRMELPPGDYVIRGLTSMAIVFPVSGIYFTPLHEKVHVAGPGVFYLGHVNAVVRERKGEEFKAGPSIPLIDQALAGASGGTFDVEVSDRWQLDEGLFRAAFPQLGNVEIHQSVLPAFDRALAQEWWEKH
jgi:hypothetical protein